MELTAWIALVTFVCQMLIIALMVRNGTRILRLHRELDEIWRELTEHQLELARRRR